MAAASFVVGDEFDSFQQLHSHVKLVEEQNFLALYKRDSRSIEAAQKKGLKRKVQPNLEYYSVQYACYHGGKTFKSKSTGVRPDQSTYKTGCPFGIWINVNNDGTKLVVTKIADEHNHEIRKEVVENLPRKRKLDSDEENSVLHMLDLHANKWLIQQHILKQTGKRITLKDLHNLAAKLNGNNDIEHIKKSLEECTGPDLDIITADDGTINVIYFQDQHMKMFFHQYPELLLMDATYKLTNVRMALYVMLCVGPNGESEIVAVFLTTSEDVLSLSSSLQSFKTKNSNWTHIRTVMTDKDMAEREAIKQAFPQVSMLLCIFHVLRAMSREVTTAKMKISEQQRSSALKDLQAITYANTEQEYLGLRDRFHSTMPASVVRYFEVNWHKCRHEWVQCWQRQNVTYGERTTNRLESVNRRLKAVIKTGSTLPVFFKDLIATVNVMRHERDVSFVNSIEKVSVKPFPRDSTEGEFARTVTPFALQFILKQLKLSTALDVTVVDGVASTVVDGETAVVGVTRCCCAFWRCMGLPCRHVFAVRRQLEIQMFTLDAVWPRWQRKSVVESHRLFLENTSVNHTQTVHISASNSRPLTLSEKFQRVKRTVQRLSELACEGGVEQFRSRLAILSQLQRVWEEGGTASLSQITDDGILPVEIAVSSATLGDGNNGVNVNESEATEDVNTDDDILPVEIDVSTATMGDTDSTNDIIVNESDAADDVDAGQIRDISIADLDHNHQLTSFELHGETTSNYCTNDDSITFDEAVEIVGDSGEGDVMISTSCMPVDNNNENVLTCSTNDEPFELHANVDFHCIDVNAGIEHNYANSADCNLPLNKTQILKFPAKINTRGRPRLNLKKTAIGQTRNAAKHCLSYNSQTVGQRTLTLMRHIVKDIRPEDVTERNLVTASNLVLKPEQLPSIVLNENVVLNILKPLLTPDAWKKFIAAVGKRKKLELWKCACCQQDTSESNTVECDSCLEWFHWTCVGIERNPRSDWYCSLCRSNV